MYKVKFDLHFSLDPQSDKNIVLTHWKMRKFKFKSLCNESRYHILKNCVIWINALNDCDFMYECDLCSHTVCYSRPFTTPCVLDSTPDRIFCRNCMMFGYPYRLLRLNHFYYDFLETRLMDMLFEKNMDTTKWITPSVHNCDFLYVDFSDKVKNRLETESYGSYGSDSENSENSMTITEYESDSDYLTETESESDHVLIGDKSTNIE